MKSGAHVLMRPTSFIYVCCLIFPIHLKDIYTIATTIASSL